jgi:hypothetical protein
MFAKIVEEGTLMSHKRRLHSFNGTDGRNQFGPLIQAADGGSVATAQVLHPSTTTARRFGRVLPALPRAGPTSQSSFASAGLPNIEKIRAMFLACRIP